MWMVFLVSTLLLLGARNSNAGPGCCDFGDWKNKYCIDDFLVKAKVLSASETLPPLAKIDEEYRKYLRKEDILYNYQIDIQDIYKGQFEQMSPVMHGYGIILEVGATYILSNDYSEHYVDPEVPGKDLYITCCGLYVKLGVNSTLDEEIMRFINGPTEEYCA